VSDKRFNFRSFENFNIPWEYHERQSSPSNPIPPLDDRPRRLQRFERTNSTPSPMVVRWASYTNEIREVAVTSVVMHLHHSSALVTRRRAVLTTWLR
jgi:hypothetical protein